MPSESASSPPGRNQPAPLSPAALLAQAAPAADAPTVKPPAESDPHAKARGLAGAAFLVMIFFVLSRVTGLLREVIIGNQFGTSAELDAYLAAFRVPDILFQLVAGGALGSAFIPTFAQYWANKQQEGAS